MMAKVESSPILQLIRRVVEDRRVRELPDHELLRRFHAEQDQAAFHALLRRHGPMVLHVCGVLGNEADVEDAFQATFLILARKAGSIRKTASLGSWLHGVAYRTALKARAQSAARQKHEARVPVRQASEPDDVSWREVQQVLHEELSGLPERYRAPLVLCYLKGATQEAAAAQLSVAKSTLRERLERGRTVLRTELMRRGLGPAALLVAAAWPAAKASASVPLSVMTSTIKAATEVAAGRAAVGVVSAKVTALTEGVLKTMFLTKIKALAGVLLVVGVLATGVGVGGWTYHPQYASEQRTDEQAGLKVKPKSDNGTDQPPDPGEDPEVIEAIRKAGGEVAFYDGEWSKWVVRVDFLEGKGNDDSLALVKGLRRVRCVNMLGAGFTESGLNHLKEVRTLRTLCFLRTDLTDAGLARLKEIPNLETLFLEEVQVIGEGLEHLKGLPLKRLLIQSSNAPDAKKLTDAGMKWVKEFPQLEELRLLSPELTDAGMEALQGLSRLRTVTLCSDQVTDAGLVHLKGKDKLHFLEIHGQRITGSGLEHLKDLTKLTYLVLNATAITNESLAHLKGLTSLVCLAFDDTKVTDTGLVHLKTCSGSLQRLSLSKTEVGDAGLEHLKGLANIQHLDLSNTQVTDAGLVHLKGLSKLQTLTLKDTAVSSAGIKELQEVLPNVQVER